MSDGSSSHKTKIHECALAYLKVKFSVIPCGRDKKPLITWKEFQDRFPTEEEVNKWFNDFPDAQIGIVTGKISNLIVVDIDDPTMDLSWLPDTAIVKTGSGGFHYYYRYAEGVTNKAGVRENVDIRGDGGYVIAPESFNLKGQYIWTKFIEEPPLFPAHLFKEEKKSPPLPLNNGFEGFNEGQRNDGMTRYIGRLLTKIHPQEWENIAWKQTKEANQKNIPPLPEYELKNIFNSISNRERANGKDRFYEEQKSKKENEYKSLYRKDTKKANHEIAKFLIGKYYIKTIGNEKREIKLYKDGIYIDGLSILKKEIQNILEEMATIGVKNEIIEKIKDFTTIQRKEFEVDKKYINLKNGIFDLDNETLFLHDPQFLFLSQLPLVYNPEATCPAINNFFNEIIKAEDLPIIQEWFGFCLYRSYAFKKAMILVGERNTGKTTLLNLITLFIGRANISGVALQKFCTDKFAVANLYQKYLNVYDELAFKDVTDNGAFKIATGNGYITGEKKYGEQFQFINHAKLMFACNKIPNVTDADDEAYFIRWLPIKFENEIKNMDSFLTEKITTESELSGLLNFALVGLKRLLRNQSFSHAEDPEEIKKKMLESDPIAGFAYNCIEESPDNPISKEELYQAFCDYCAKEKLPMCTMVKFGKNLPKYAPYIGNSESLINNKHMRVWRNVKIKFELVKPHLPHLL